MLRTEQSNRSLPSFRSSFLCVDTTSFFDAKVVADADVVDRTLNPRVNRSTKSVVTAIVSFKKNENKDSNRQCTITKSCCLGCNLVTVQAGMYYTVIVALIQMIFLCLSQTWVVVVSRVGIWSMVPWFNSCNLQTFLYEACLSKTSGVKKFGVSANRNQM